MDVAKTSVSASAKTSAKTRALKKYEAAPVAYASEPGDPRLNLFSPFGPLIAQAAMPQVLVDSINRYADTQVRGDTGSEFLLPKDVTSSGGEQSLGHQTEKLIERYLLLMDEAAPSRIRIDAFWIVSQYAGTPSPVHFHSGDISGVLYLKVPQLDREDEELRKTYISGRHAGYINFLIGGKQRLSKSLVSFRPGVGDFYIFPGWLLHGAEPFRGRGERRSLAFNAYVEAAD
jgi:Putative 2OG-Fe(II) oxygenase